MSTNKDILPHWYNHNILRATQTDDPALEEPEYLTRSSSVILVNLVAWRLFDMIQTPEVYSQYTCTQLYEGRQRAARKQNIVWIITWIELWINDFIGTMAKTQTFSLDFHQWKCCLRFPAKFGKDLLALGHVTARENCPKCGHPVICFQQRNWDTGIWICNRFKRDIHDLRIWYFSFCSKMAFRSQRILQVHFLVRNVWILVAIEYCCVISKMICIFTYLGTWTM